MLSIRTIDNIQQTLIEHQNILDGLLKRDGDLAEWYMGEHLHNVSERLIKDLVKTRTKYKGERRMGKWKFPPDGGHMEKPTQIYLQTMTGLEVKERLKKNDLIILPIGSTEAHGAHACSGEDTFLVTRMAEAVAQKTGCTVAEPIWYGSHPYHHLGMPGTVVVPEETFIANLRAVIAGLWNAGFRKQILFNGHGQDYAIPVAMHQFGKKYQIPMLLVNVNWWFVIPEHIRDKAHGGPFETPFVHGDECETSFSMALFPEIIQMKDAVDTAGKVYSRKDTSTNQALPTTCRSHSGSMLAAVP